MKRKNWMEWLRGCLTANLSFWVDEEENPVIQAWFVGHYGALKARRLTDTPDGA